MELLFIIPGLALSSAEYAFVPDAKILENPGFHLSESSFSKPSFPIDYTLEDVAEAHAKTVAEQVNSNSEITLVGFSMGGMILSVMATKFRHLLPENTKFIFLNTSPNLKANPVLTKEILSRRKLDSESLVEFFHRTLQPFFSDRFIETDSGYQSYIDYRATPKNILAVEEYMKQVSAVVGFEGEQYYRQLDPSEVRFIFSGADKLIHEGHIEDTRQLIPDVQQRVIKGVGHMIHIENQSAFKEAVSNKRRTIWSRCAKLLTLFQPVR